MTTLDLIVGARPNFMKIASITQALAQAAARGGSLRSRLVHTGQHYDHAMSEAFFGQLGIPVPDVNLEVGSGTQAEQTAGIMLGYERLVMSSPPALCLVVGDVTSTLACALVARKAGLPVAHVEAGIRSGDWSMPEEINRVVTDSITNFFFTTTADAGENLKASGVPEERIFFVGNTMIDTLLANMDRLRPPSWWTSAALEHGRYVVATLHRPANVDSPEKLRTLVETLCACAEGLPVLFPVHPRTDRTLAMLPQVPANLVVVPPQPYLEFNYLVRHAKAVVTDSGGITEETTVMGVPCITLRDNTERPETITIGTNELIGAGASGIPAAMARVLAGKWKHGSIPERWDGKAGNRIVEILEGLLAPHSNHGRASRDFPENQDHD